MPLKDLISQLEELYNVINNQLDAGNTSIENCHKASRKFFKIIEKADSLNPHLADYHDLDDLKERFEKVLGFSYVPEDDNGEDEKTYSGYCTIQILRAADKLMHTIK